MAITYGFICGMCGKKYGIFVPKARLYAADGDQADLNFWQQVDDQEEAAGEILKNKALAKQIGAKFIDSRETDSFRCQGCGHTWLIDLIVTAFDPKFFDG